MQSMLEDLYCGNIGFDSGYYGQDTPFVKAARKKHDSLEKLMATLGDGEKELFEQYCDAQGDMESITRYATYATTLQFGIRLMVELFMDRRN